MYCNGFFDIDIEVDCTERGFYAQDENGLVWYYPTQPYITEMYGQWGGNGAKLVGKGKPNCLWKHTLNYRVNDTIFPVEREGFYAQDENGETWYYENQPYPKLDALGGYWSNDSQGFANVVTNSLEEFTRIPSWRDSLVKVDDLCRH